MAERPARPVRGDPGAYQRYLAGMNASMRQKVALTAAHLMGEGRVADMGMGSGTGSEALAALYPRLEVIGVDLDPTLVEGARERFNRPNLQFRVGDIAAEVFPPGSLDGVFDSSVLHHVTSFNGYDHSRAAQAIEAQVKQLADHGVLIVRDFVAPGREDVRLDLDATNGEPGDDPRTCSDAALFERFAREFRRLSTDPGFPYGNEDSGQSGPPIADGFRRYRLSHRHAVEFVLRKDYRPDWEREVEEEYTYFTQQEFEETFRRLGLRILASTPVRNPWIVRNRFRNKLLLWDLDGGRLDEPATNYIIAGEKVPAGDGVDFVERVAAEPMRYLQMEHFRHRRLGKVMDLVRRPNLTIDILPWFLDEGEIYVLARAGYPRPVLRSRPRGAQPIEGARRVGYVTEPLNAVLTDRPVGQTVEETLARAAGIEPSQILDFRQGTTYYPSPGGILEEVRSVLVQVEPVFVHCPLHDLSGFSTSGRVRAIAARQVLRSAQVGGLPDARLELNVYELLSTLGFAPGPWIGEELRLASGKSRVEVDALEDLARRPPRREFERCRERADFLALECALFDELDRNSRVVASAKREFVVPRPFSNNTVAVALLRTDGEETYLGLDDDDLPAAQSISGNSQLMVAPAWRLPHEVDSIRATREWVRDRLHAEYALTILDTWGLGGSYHPSAGLTPEVVYPLAIDVRESGGGGRKLHWIALSEIPDAIHHHPDGHLRVLTWRAAHAMGHLSSHQA